MAFFKKLKFWKKLGNSKPGIVSRILKCFVPCVRRRTRSPSQENSNSSTQENSIRQIRHQCEVILQAERQHEHSDKQKLTRNQETFWTLKRTKESPHSVYFDGITFENTEQGGQTEDFKVFGILGKGAFGRVLLAKKRSTGVHSSNKEVLALKFVQNKRVKEVEKEVFLRAVGHPFLVQLHTCFQTNKSLCYVMEYMGGGTLHSLCARRNRRNEDIARFYAAEIILGVDFLHNCGIVHRDIKPANILLDSDGHCKLADFGLCKVGIFTTTKTSGVCGTRRYMAPEVRRGDLYGPEVDWWSVGCVIFEMMLGTCRASYDCIYRELFPTQLTHAAASIVWDFLHPDPGRRLGAHGDTRSVLRHPFFNNVNWDAVLHKRVTPPVKPPTLEFLNTNPDAPGHGNRHHEAILEAPLHQDAQLVLEATHNREAAIVLEAPLSLHAVDIQEKEQSPERVEDIKETEESPEHIEDVKEMEESPEDKNKEESVQETLDGLIVVLKAVTITNQVMYYRDILFIVICFCFVVWQCLLLVVYINIVLFV